MSSRLREGCGEPRTPARYAKAAKTESERQRTEIRDQRSAEFELGFDLLPRHAAFPFIALDCTAKFNQIFDVLETLVQSTHLGGQRFERRFLKRGRVTHKPSSDP